MKSGKKYKKANNKQRTKMRDYTILPGSPTENAKVTSVLTLLSEPIIGGVPRELAFAAQKSTHWKLSYSKSYGWNSTSEGVGPTITAEAFIRRYNPNYLPNLY